MITVSLFTHEILLLSTDWALVIVEKAKHSTTSIECLCYALHLLTTRKYYQFKNVFYINLELRQSI